MHIYSFKHACFLLYHVSLESIYTTYILDKGIPNVKMHQENRAANLSPGIIPSPEEAVASYQHCGGQLTLVSTFGEDPLSPSLDSICQQEFARRHAAFHPVFHAAVNGDEHPFRDGLQHFISITKQLAAP